MKVTQKPGEASIRKVELELPEVLPSRLPTLQQACTEQQFAKNPAGCPEASFVGTATAHTPVLSAPLSGPAILVSHGGAAFPDLVFLLQGEGVHVELVGNTDIKKETRNGVVREITYSKFEAVPDAPISSFETNLPSGPHSILTGYGNLCEESLAAPTTIVAQNGARMVQNTQITAAGCSAAAPKLTIVKTRVKGAKVLVTVKLSAAGTVAVSGSAVKTLKKGMAAGQRQLTLVAHQGGQEVRQAPPQAEPASHADGRQADGHQDHEREAVSAVGDDRHPARRRRAAALRRRPALVLAAAVLARPRRASRGRNRAPTPAAAPNRASPKAPPTRCPPAAPTSSPRRR